MKIKFCCKAPNLKLTKKLTAILSAVLGVILAVGIVLCAVLGFNNSVKDVKTVSVSMDEFYYSNFCGEDVEDVCEDVFAALGLEVQDKDVGRVKNDLCEVVYSFDKDASTKDIRDAKNAIDGIVSLSEEWKDADIKVTTGEVEVVGTMAKHYILRGIIAAAVFAVLALVYVWIRYKFHVAAFVVCGSILGVALTTAVLAIVRIPVTPAIAAVLAASALFTAVALLFNFNKLRMAQKEENVAEKSTEELVSSTIAWKETLSLTVALGVSLLVMICVGKAAIAWFSFAAIIALLVSAFLGLVYGPALYVFVKKYADKVAASKSSDYKGAKKTVKEKKEENTPAVAEENAD
ncbi:MAG: hypothetical protein IJV83_03295 [Clostridia bacterium]|nr:hypothetical protein [Clostridia bacterium]